MVEQMVSAARRLQADQKTGDAVAELEKGLALFPSDPRLRTLHDTLRVELGQASRKKARLSDLNELRNLRQNARNATRTDELRSIYERTQNVAARYQEEPEFQSAAREIERLVRARAPSSRREADVFSTGTKSKSRLILIAGVAAALLLIVGFAFVVRALFYRSSSLIRIATVPAGATVTVAGQSCADPNCQLQLREGTYTAEAHLDGYHPSSQSFTVKSGNRNANITLILKPLEGVSPAKGIAATNESSLASQSSVVTTLPAPARGLSKGTLKVIASAGRARSTALANADVIVDGRYYGQTGTDGTFTLPLQPGQYTVTLRKDGYSVPEKGTNVRAGEDTTLRFTAQPAAGATQVVQAAESNPVTSGAGTLQKVNPPPVQVATNTTPPSGGINNSTPGAVEPSPNIATRSSSTGSGAPAQPAPSASTVVANPRNRESADTNAAPSLLVSDKKAIATALEQYKDAYESESLDELLKIWPSMSKDQKKALRAAFESAQAIRISLACGDPTILGDAATVKCNQEVKYTRAGKVEPPQTVSIDILLTRKRTVWLVATLRAN
jgi:Carboxypeptidase regulatory-like domain/PEGA domain